MESPDLEDITETSDEDVSKAPLTQTRELRTKFFVAIDKGPDKGKFSCEEPSCGAILKN